MVNPISALDKTMNVDDFVRRLREVIAEEYTPKADALLERAGMDQLQDRETCGQLRALRFMRDTIDQIYREHNSPGTARRDDSQTDPVNPIRNLYDIYES